MPSQKREKLDVENLIHELKNVSQTEVSWTGYQVKSSDDVRNSINQLIHLIKKTDWKESEESKKEVQSSLKSLEKILLLENDLKNEIGVKADCKMRKTIDRRFAIILEIIEHIIQERKGTTELDTLLNQIEEIKEKNLRILEENVDLVEEEINRQSRYLSRQKIANRKEIKNSKRQNSIEEETNNDSF